MSTPIGVSPTYRRSGGVIASPLLECLCQDVTEGGRAGWESTVRPGCASLPVVGLSRSKVKILFCIPVGERSQTVFLKSRTMKQAFVSDAEASGAQRLGTVGCISTVI